MDILQQAADDRADILGEHGRTVTITDSESTEYTAKAEVFRIDMETDPQTGVQFYNPKTAVTVAYSDLEVIPEVGWTISITDSIGGTLDGQVAEARVDRTTGAITIIVEELS